MWARLSFGSKQEPDNQDGMSWKCEQCKKSFIGVSNLRTHSGEKPLGSKRQAGSLPGWHQMPKSCFEAQNIYTSHTFNLFTWNWDLQFSTISKIYIPKHCKIPETYMYTCVHVTLQPFHILPRLTILNNIQNINPNTPKDPCIWYVYPQKLQNTQTYLPVIF